MSALLAKLNLTNARILTPQEALAVIAARGEWTALAQAVANHLRNTNEGTLAPLSALTFDELNLTVDDFRRKTASGTKKVGDIDYSGIRMASRKFGLNVKPTVDGFATFQVFADPEKMIAECKAQAVKQAARAKKAAAAKK